MKSEAFSEWDINIYKMKNVYKNILIIFFTIRAVNESCNVKKDLHL